MRCATTDVCTHRRHLTECTAADCSVSGKGILPKELRMSARRQRLMNQDAVQGVRIDYALLSPGLLQQVVSCEIISTLPPKWSDHAALLLELKDIPAVQPHPPCALSSLRMKRFAKPKASIASMFAKRMASDGTGPALPAAKRSKVGAPAAEPASDTEVASNLAPDSCASAALPAAQCLQDISAHSGLPPAKHAKLEAAAAELDSQAVLAASQPGALQEASAAQACAIQEGTPRHPQESRPAAFLGTHQHNASGIAAVTEKEMAVEGHHGRWSISDRAFQSQQVQPMSSNGSAAHVDASKDETTEDMDVRSEGQTLPTGRAFRKGKRSQHRTKSTAGMPPASPKQKSIRGFFAAQQ